MDALTQNEVLQILEVTDRLGLHREAVRIPLWTEGGGRLRLVSGGTKLEIVGPAEGYDAWLTSLPDAIGKLDLSRVPRA